jgi:hypothetical protein
MAERNVSQHKRLAMGEQLNKYAPGGMVMPRVKGMPMSPITKMKRNNGVPGMKKGGKSNGC